MTPFKHINRYKIRDAMPTILTATACIGVVATGVSSAMAMKQYIKKTEEPCDYIKEAIKSAAIPTLIGAGTIASFIFARKADKAVIAGLSAAVASLSSRGSSKKALVEHTSEKLDNMAVDIVVDEDGDVFINEYLNCSFRVKKDTLEKALYSINRNYQLRGGIASVYEYLRLMGVKKTDIYDQFLEWTKYVGWNYEYYGDFSSWIDGYVSEKDHEFGFQDTPMPIVADVPKKVMNICHVDEQDLETLELYQSDDILPEIESNIRDAWVE